MTVLSRPRGVLFDLGGTILEERSYDLAAGVRELLSGYPTRRSAGDETAVLAELQAEIDRVHSRDAAEFTLRSWLEDELKPGTRASLAEAERALWQRIAHLEPMPGAREGIAALRGDGVPMAVVSNAVFAADTLASELSRHGLLQPFAFVLSSADLGSRKPHPAIFHAALTRLGTPAHETWFVGDSFANDIAGAHAVGATPIWLGPPGEPERPDVPHHRVGSWPELIDLYRSTRT